MFSDYLVKSYFQRISLPFPEIIDTIASLKKKITYFESYRKLKYKEILFIIFLFILFPHATGIGIFFESFLPRIIFYKLLYLIRIP